MITLSVNSWTRILYNTKGMCTVDNLLQYAIINQQAMASNFIRKCYHACMSVCHLILAHIESNVCIVGLSSNLQSKNSGSAYYIVTFITEPIENVC